MKILLNLLLSVVSVYGMKGDEDVWEGSKIIKYTKNDWGKVPQELRQHIFSRTLKNAGQKEFLNLAFVNKQFLSEVGACITKLALNSNAAPSDEELRKFVNLYSNVKEIKLKGESGADVTLKMLSQLKRLNSLHMEFSKITNEKLAFLSTLTNLTDLDLSWSFNITDISPLSSLTNLKELNLEDCFNITEDSILSVLSLKNLSHVNLYGCAKIKEETLLSLIKAPPKFSMSYKITDSLLKKAKEVRLEDEVKFSWQ